ncbi:hypothetical protein RT717_10465 [Imperialibacter roseus]|uniref:HPt domain-containing protein n=1 Tax=Imperialibacter roseus TaxID=1324217 RepID=A0ABZ0IX18_9BACT|nr:hypothetical protein [Imperialibacter roseus]WOK09057.1 hypothetical protein RT717_10465 [Imperialibacter roseus]
MNTAVTLEQPKPLNIDFSSYTDDDQEFKKELCLLLVDNVKELHIALQESLQTGDLSAFSTVCHKVTVSIDMIDDHQVNTLIEKVKDAFYAQHPLLIAQYTSRLSAALLQLVIDIEAEIAMR